MTNPRKIKRYGWRPDIPDYRDHIYSAPREALVTLPPAVDLQPHCPPVYDQGQLGSCTANAIGAGFEFDQIKEKLPHVWTPSRLFIYYNERVIENSTSEDSGAQIRDGIKSVASQGACSEDLWKYDEALFAHKPPPAAYANAKQHLVTSYQRVSQNLQQMKGCLASGYPFVIGFTVYDSFESEEVATTGILNMPGPSESVVGGHAVLVVGYDDAKLRWKVRNSWSAQWGLGGYFWMPYSYLLDPNLSDDFWTIRTVLGTPKS
jgi:C1A family cysteine protease